MVSSKRPLFCIIDASSFIFRAYYAVRPLSNSKGLPTNAVYGFAQMMLKVLDDFKPAYIAVVYDTKHPSFRKEMYSAYKANRGTMPEDLSPQIPYIKKFVETLGLPGFEEPGFEADDIIATLAEHAAKISDEADVCIISSDKDLMQLVNEHVFLYDTMKDLKYDATAVKEKLGVPPEQVADYLGIVGDSSDNIPGVKGLGPKSAVALLEEFGSVAGIYENLASIKKEAQRAKLEEHKDLAFLSKELATVKRDMDFHTDWHTLKCKPNFQGAFIELLKELEFGGLIKRISGESKDAAGEVTVVESGDLVKKANALYQGITSLSQLKDAFKKYAHAELVVLDTETDSLVAHDQALVGFSFCCDAKEAFYVPVAHKEGAQCEKSAALKLLSEFLAGKKVVGQNLKFDCNALRAVGVEVAGESIVFDTMVASYVLEADSRHGLDALAKKFLNHDNIPYSQVCGEGKNEIPFSEVPIEMASEYAAEDAHVTYLLYQLLKKDVDADKKLKSVFYEIDMPLVVVLADMEWEGVSIDSDLLHRLSNEFTVALNDMEKRAYEVAGEEFNLASPKQLQTVLFEKLKLPALKKTKTGYSTDVDVLEKLSVHHELPAIILNYREIAKLKNTYVDVLPSLVHKNTDRVHASFNQTVAATGRLSSSNPNLQNIPIRTEDGKKIRASFVARKGWKLVGADYSQIELRILAAMCGDKMLKQAFQRGEDIHALTASEIFGVAKDKVSTDQRRQAKAINFGILYGKTAFSLGEELGIPRGEAAEIIEKYFDRYPTVKNFLESLKDAAKKTGYAETAFGRKRMIEGIHSTNKMILAMGERMAVNTPLQGTAADLIKIAMVRLHKRLASEGFKARLILQVHDELVVEAPLAEVDRVQEVIRATMESAGEGTFDVPFTVDVGVADNWLGL